MKLLNPIPSASLSRWPKGNLYQGFGENVALYKKYCNGMPGHNGIDLITFEDDKIVAAHSGLVCHADLKKGFGLSVYIYNQGLKVLTIYAHLSEILVSVGAHVAAGEQIGKEGNTGFVISGKTAYWGNAPAGKGVHLHFGLKTNAEESLAPGWQTSFSDSGMTITVPATQGIWGWVDPLPYLIDKKKMLKLFKNEYGDIFEIRRIGGVDTYFRIRKAEVVRAGQSEDEIYNTEILSISDKELRTKYKEGGIVG